VWTVAIALWNEQDYIEAHQPIRKFEFSGPRKPNGRQVMTYKKLPKQPGGNHEQVI
jgi:hypothetical protein